jgi:hypothetical protein
VEAEDGQTTPWPFESAAESGSTVYHHGTCICGNLGVELLSPLSELELKEDNCSSCVRVCSRSLYDRLNQSFDVDAYYLSSGDTLASIQTRTRSECMGELEHPSISTVKSMAAPYSVALAEL